MSNPVSKFTSPSPITRGPHVCHLCLCFCSCSGTRFICTILILICIFLIISAVEHLFMSLLPFACLLWRNVYPGSLSILWLDFFFLWSLINSLYVLWILAHYQMYDFSDTFSHLVGCLIILLVVFFYAEAFNMMQSHFIFAFVDFAFVVIRIFVRVVIYIRRKHLTHLQVCGSVALHVHSVMQPTPPPSPWLFPSYNTETVTIKL